MTALKSNDLRERVVAAVSSSDSIRAVAARFGVVAAPSRDRVVAPGKIGGYRKRTHCPEVNVRS